MSVPGIFGVSIKMIALSYSHFRNWKAYLLSCDRRLYFRFVKNRGNNILEYVLGSTISFPVS
jgi:hypothetical protein